jgi:phospholipid/cholesterol/gamma-HCH transport system substrate-binding protein
MNLNNPTREQALELKAGIFVLIGLVFIAMMAFKFGRLGQGLFQQYYSLTVTFPSADGLIKNSDVQLAGARIGYVAEKPVITSGGSGVTLPLKILANVHIPRDTNFEVSSSGLLGDKFVDITPKKDFDAKDFNPSDPSEVLAPGETVAGSSSGGLLGVLQTELETEVQKLTVVTDKINTGILSAENQRNLADTLSHLQGTSKHFEVASQDLDSVVLNAKGAVDSAKQTLGTVNAAAADVHTAIDDAKTTLAAADDLLTRAQTGNGPVATLLNDAELSQNLKVFVANLREHGVLFYKDKEHPAAPSPSPALHRQL